jgi:hypothetical protein
MNTINVEAGDMGLVIAFVLMLGGIIKNFTPVKNEFIPLITWALGGLLYQWLADGWADPRQWMMALLSVAGATGLHSATRATVEVVKPGAVVPLLGLIGLMGLAGCAPLNERVEAGGAYRVGDVIHGELYALDASFDLAYSGLDGIFKHEQANRKALWDINPNIKRRLDKIRVEAQVAKKDYAMARAAYLAQPAIGPGELNAAVHKLNAANAAALAVVAVKGIQ